MTKTKKTIKEIKWEKVLRKERVKLLYTNIKNKEVVRRWSLVFFLAAIGFGTVFVDFRAMILGVILFNLIANMNTAVKLDAIQIELLEGR